MSVEDGVERLIDAALGRLHDAVALAASVLASPLPPTRVRNK